MITFDGEITLRLKPDPTLREWTVEMDNRCGVAWSADADDYLDSIMDDLHDRTDWDALEEDA